MKVYVSWGTADFASELEIAVDSREQTSLKILDNHIHDIENCIDAWVEFRRGKNLLSASSTGVFTVEPEYIREIPQLITMLESSSSMKFHFGVGVEIEEANAAMKYAIERGDHIALFDEEMLEEDEEDDPLLKSDFELSHPEAHGQKALDSEDPTEAVMSALSKIRDHADAIERLKQSNPEAYQAFRNITQAMVAMAKQIAEVQSAAKEEAGELEKSMAMPAAASTQIGSASGYSNMAQQLGSMEHIKTEKLSPGLFHHVFKAGPEGEIHSHTVSTSQDPAAPHLAQLHGSTEEHMGKPGFAISTSAVHPDAKGSGFGKVLYLSALKHHGTLLSDTATSSSANNAWKWLGAQHGVQAQMGQSGADRHVATMAKSEDIDELIKAIRLPKPKKTPKKISHKFPTPPPMIAAAPGSVKDGKIKVTSIEPETLETRKTGWNGVRSGMIVGPKGSPVSSREPNTE